MGFGIGLGCLGFRVGLKLVEGSSLAGLEWVCLGFSFGSLAGLRLL